jgi:hypothetical protein
MEVRRLLGANENDSESLFPVAVEDNTPWDPDIKVPFLKKIAAIEKLSGKVSRTS